MEVDDTGGPAPVPAVPMEIESDTPLVAPTPASIGTALTKVTTVPLKRRRASLSAAVRVIAFLVGFAKYELRFSHLGDRFA